MIAHREAKLPNLFLTIKGSRKKYSGVCRIVKDGSQFELLLTNLNNFPHSLIDIGKLYGENLYLFHFHAIFFETVTRTAYTQAVFTTQTYLGSIQGIMMFFTLLPN